MGCGGSKLDPEQNTLPARLRPILRRRLEEILARKSNNTTSDASKQELLEGVKTPPRELDEEQEDTKLEVSTDPYHASHCTQYCPPTPQKISIDKASPESCEEIHGNKFENNVPSNKEKMLEQCGDDKNDDNGQFLRKQRASEGSLEELGEEIASDDYEQAELLLCPGSPSFRVYCQISPEREEPVDVIFSQEVEEPVDITLFPEIGEHVDEHVNGGRKFEKSHRDILSKESSCSNEVSIKKIPVKRGKRGMKFKIIPKGRKNIFNNMHSFYNFPCSTHNNNTKILEKAAA